jgi:hypothetical protein
LKKIQPFLAIAICFCIPAVPSHLFHLFSDELVETDFFSPGLILENSDTEGQLAEKLFKGSSSLLTLEPSFDPASSVLRC